MTTNQKGVWFAFHNGLCVFKLAGELRHGDGDGLDALIQRRFGDNANRCDKVLVDITAVNYLDSTMLGLLAMIGRHALKTTGQRATMLSTNGDTTELITSMCLDQAFLIVDEPLAEVADWQPVERIASDEKQHAQTVLVAHEALLTLSDKNKEIFQPVVDLMRQDVP